MSYSASFARVSERGSRMYSGRRKSGMKAHVSNSSVFPSYSNLTLPYCVVCRQRYHRVVKAQRRQFIREVMTQERLQPKALDGVRLHREFCNAILRKPSTAEEVKLTFNEERRLADIMQGILR